jgi:hypothetical protein
LEEGLECNWWLIAGPIKSLVLSFDTFLVGKAFVSSLCKQLNESIFLGLEESNIIAVASHSHFAPSLSEIQTPVNFPEKEYIEFVIDTLVINIKESLKQEPEKTLMYHRVGHTESSVNRRLWSFARFGKNLPEWKMIIGPNVSGFNDRELHLIQMTNSNNETVAIIWNFSCHPANYFNHNISSHYIGRVRSHIRQHYNNENLAVLFLPGFAGNINEFSNSQNTSFRLKTLLKRPITFEVFNKEKYNNWSNNLAKYVVSLLEFPGELLTEDDFDHKHLKIPLASLLEGENPYSTLDLSLMKVKGLNFLFISAEMFNELKVSLNNIIEGQTIFCGYLSNTYGYMLSESELEKKGYEAELAFEFYGHTKGSQKKGAIKSLNRAIEMKF